MLHRQEFHKTWLAETVNHSSPAAMAALSKVQGVLAQGGLGPNSAAGAAPGVLSMLVQREAFIAGIADAFLVAALILALTIPLGFFLTRKTVEEERKKQYQQWAHLAPPGMGGPPGGRPGAGAPAGLPAGSPQDAGPGGGGSKGLELEFAPGNGRS